MNNPSVTCLQLSYGRPQLSVEAVECFLRQTYTNKKLIIVNTHPSPVYFENKYDNIEVYNIKPLDHLSDVYRFGMDLIKSDYFCVWDDDDLFMPWHVENRVDYILKHSEYNAVGHKFGVMTVDNVIKNMGGNMFVSQYLYKNNGFRPDKNKCCWDVSWSNHQWKKGYLDFPNKPSYIYRWGTGESHISGLGGDEEAQHRGYINNITDKHKIKFEFPWVPSWKIDYCKLIDDFIQSKNIKI